MDDFIAPAELHRQRNVRAGANRHRVAREKRVVCETRHSVTAPQSVTVLTALADYEAYNRRSRYERPGSYPVGDENCFNMLKGELAFGYLDDHRAPRLPNPNMTAVKSFTAFNGLPFNAELQFMGVVDKEYNRDLHNGDTAVTLRIFGTHTIFNTGDETIPAGYSVYWAHPLIYKDGGTVRPRTQIHGVPDNKFVPALRPLCLDLLNTAFLSVFQEVRAVVERDPVLALPVGGGPWFNTHKTELEGIVQKYSFNRDVDLIAPRDANVPRNDLEEEAAELMQTDPVRRFVGVVLALSGVHSEWWHKNRDELQFMRNLDAARSHTFTTKRRRGDDPPPAAIPEVAELVPYLISSVLDQYHLLQRRVIGKALNTAAPGKQVNPLCYVHCYAAP
jgi:hypothetical protein